MLTIWPRRAPEIGLAWKNLWERRTRTLVGALGMFVSLFLVFLQFGFLEAAKTGSTLLYERFDFDLAIVSSRYQFQMNADGIDRIRLVQARAHPLVADTFSLNVKASRWTDPGTKLRSSLLLIGIDRNPDFIADPAIRGALDAMRGRLPVVVDGYSHRDFGDLREGRVARVAGREATIVGRFELGMFFYADGSAIVSNERFPTLSGRSGRRTSVGLVRLTDGASAAQTKRALERRLPADVKVYTRAAFLAEEQGYFVDVKPLGVIFSFGALVALAVGAVTLYQVLSAELLRKWREYAVIKAMGFSSGFVHRVALVQMALLGVLGFVPASIVSDQVFDLVRARTHFPLLLDLALTVEVALVTAATGAAVALLLLPRLGRCTPTQLIESTAR